LPPGRSSVWTTAYVGYKLNDLPKHLAVKAAGPIRSASQWLIDCQFADGGWGYNPAAGSDADSTSFAILMLKAAGQRVPETGYEHLLRYQQRDGGFSTFLSTGKPNAWTVSHPDVTPIALLALMTRNRSGTDTLIQRGIDQVRQQQTPDGIWKSYWWDTFLYGTDASLALLRKAGVPIAPPTKLSRIKPANVFETALLISALLNAEPRAAFERVHVWIGQLLSEQQANGSWPSEPILRVTRRDCFEPWDFDDPGPLFADSRRLFTSATVLSALSRSYSLLSKENTR
jgi:hypothetical protein